MFKSIGKKSGIALLALGLTAYATPAYSVASIEYMKAVGAGVSLEVFATAGDSIDGYLIGGVPDGMGVIPSGNKLRVITNHEWSNANAIASQRLTANGGGSGSYISEMHYDLTSKKIVAGKDFREFITWYNYEESAYGIEPVAPIGAELKDSSGSINHGYSLNRFCSSSLAPAGFFYDKKTGTGYKGAVYLTGEEGGDESRGFAGNQDGEAVQLPRLGLAAWETFVPAPTNSKATVVFGNEDGSATDSQLWMYAGTKQKTGEWYEQAGFANGGLYVLAADVANDNEFRAKYGKNTPAKVSFKSIDWKQNGKLQNDQARLVGMELARVEDGHFDPKNPKDFYFLTTESNKDPKATAPNPALPTTSRDGGALWKLSLTDVSNPNAGATLTMLLDGSEDIYLSKPDNMVVDNSGNILIQEDPGNNAALARVVTYRIKDGKIATLAAFKGEYFGDATASGFITLDEESSGVIEVTQYFAKGKSDKAKYYMFVAQVHATTAKSRPDLTTVPGDIANAIEGGQWYLMKVADWSSIYGS